MNKFTDFINNSKIFLSKHSPEILTGFGIIGFISSTVMAVKATPKALYLIEEHKDEIKTKMDTVKVAWKPYIPALGLAITSTACIIGASAVNYKRNAALGAAYALSERTLIRYRDKVVDHLGERKEKEIRDEVAQDTMNSNKLDNSQVIITQKGNTLCMDTISGRYFKSDIDTIRKTVNDINRRMTYDHYISLNELYYALGLEGVKNGDLMGWSLDTGLLDPSFSTCLTDDDQPCIVMDFAIAPKYDFDKLI